MYCVLIPTKFVGKGDNMQANERIRSYYQMVTGIKICCMGWQI